MNAIKERLIGAITIMKDNDAEKLWEILQRNYEISLWDNIPEVEPDEWDLQMLNDIENNPDCHEFVSAKEMEEVFNAD